MNKSFIEEYYERYDEDGRLEKKHQKIEFLTTIRYVEKYLSKDSRILEVGAGTGRYSLYFSRKGYQVDSVELVEHNINIFKSKLNEDDTVNIMQGNALDLDMYVDNTFDTVMVLGPMYHMYTKEDKLKVISEALRVLKPGGILHISYISHDAVIVNWGLQGGKLLEGNELNMFTEDYRCISTPKDLFAMMDVKEIKDLMSRFKTEQLHIVGTDGIAPWFRDLFTDMSDDFYNEWLRYHFMHCEREDLIGYSNHVLYITRKKG